MRIGIILPYKYAQSMPKDPCSQRQGQHSPEIPISIPGARHQPCADGPLRHAGRHRPRLRPPRRPTRKRLYQRPHPLDRRWLVLRWLMGQPAPAPAPPLDSSCWAACSLRVQPHSHPPDHDMSRHMTRAYSRILLDECERPPQYRRILGRIPMPHIGNHLDAARDTVFVQQCHQRANVIL